MAFTEFYCQSGGSNLNAGSTTDNAAIFTFTSGTWVQATRIFTATGADLSGVSVGMWASVYNDGASTAVFVGRITAVDDTLDTITIDATASGGTAPTDGTGNRSIKVGGAWKGPNGTDIVPFSIVAATMTNSGGDYPRINMKNDATYSVTGLVTASGLGPIYVQGYTSSVGDGGKWTLDGTSVGASFVVLSVTNSMHNYADMIVQNNGTTGTSDGISLTGGSGTFRRVVVNNVRGDGFNFTTPLGFAEECEAYSCNTANTSGDGGFKVGSNSYGYFKRCISHDNSGSNNVGFINPGIVTGFVMEHCIADSNGSHGYHITIRAQHLVMSHCDAYNNGGDGARIDVTTTAGAVFSIQNCNFIDNGGYGINDVEASIGHTVFVTNCGFGSGTAANTSGTTNLGIFGVETGSVTYGEDLTPWNAPSTGDFKISLAAAKGAGRGTFTETQASYSGTTSYPDIGAAQHQDSGSGGGTVNVGRGFMRGAIA